MASDKEKSDRLVILASASPRRQELLEQFRVPFRLLPAMGVDENRPRGGASEVAGALALEKARWSWDRAVEEKFDLRRLWILAADTVVALDGEVLGKPADAADARCMLHRLSGRTHQVITACAVISPGKVERVELETSQVVFKRLSEAEIAGYLESGDPFGKAGAYGIQSGGASLVAGFTGCYYNIVGLPVRRALALLGLPAPECGCELHPLQRGKRGCQRGGGAP
ncbi:MAG: septum formation protein Maf [Planctomycetes bacterium]|nr:septum formation protein Maf [Planctomycetota bacterium]